MATGLVIIDPQSLSFETVKEDLETYLQSLPDYDSWRDFFESGAGTTVIELMGGIGAFLSYHSISSRRESNINTLHLYSSAVNIANILGYPVNRRVAPQVELTITVTEDVFWDRLDPIAYYGELPVCLETSQQLLTGVDNVVTAVVGEWKEYDYTAAESVDFARLLIQDESVDNSINSRVVLTINGLPVGLAVHAVDALPTQVVCRTHPDGALLLFGDDVITKKLRKNNILKVTYISTQGKLGVVLSVVDLAMSVGSLTAISTLDPGSDRDSLRKIVLLAPGYHSTSRRMVTIPDHAAIVKGFSGDLISANAQKKANVCCTAQVCYLFDDYHTANATEKENIQEYLDEFRVVAEKVEIVDPVQWNLTLTMTCIVDEGTDITELEQSIRDAVDMKTLQLGKTFHISDVATLILDNVDGVNRVYIELPIKDKSFEYNEYLKLETLNLTVSTDQTLVVEIVPLTGIDGYELA